VEILLIRRGWLPCGHVFLYWLAGWWANSQVSSTMTTFSAPFAADEDISFAIWAKAMVQDWINFPANAPR